MKLWIGGEMGPWPEELDHEISKQKLSIRHTTEKPLEDFLSKRDYGPGLKILHLIPMIFRPDVKLYEERKQYNPKKGDADYRLKIDYDEFIQTDEVGKRKLIINNLLHAIRSIALEAKNNGVLFDSQQMEIDIKSFLKIND